jgi:hypothetical protein
MSITEQEFLSLMQRYEANIAIGGSTLRNQGAEDVIEVARNFLARLDLSKRRQYCLTITGTANSKGQLLQPLAATVKYRSNMTQWATGFIRLPA